MVTTLFQHAVRTAVHSGAGVRTMLPSLIHSLGGKRMVLFTDQGLNKAGVTEKITSLFKIIPGSIQLVGVFDEIQQDARVTTINQAIQFVKENRADTFVALGGGSVLDTVKSVRWAVHKGYNDIREGISVSTREQWPEAQPITTPFIAFPTTAGTGSEMSNAAIIYNEELKLKATLVNPFICPDLAMLDPELTVGLPPKITAFTGMDALTHAIEGYFSSKANPFTDAYALQAVRLIAEHLPVAVREGTNLEARANLLTASSMAILAFTLATSAIPVHNMAHTFGAKFGIPHGLANAVLLPNVMESLPQLYLPRILSFAGTLGLPVNSEKPEAALENVIAYIRDLRSEIGLPDHFAEFNIESLENIVLDVYRDPTGARFKIPADVIERIAKEVSGKKETITN